LESLGIKEHVIAWKQLFDQIKDELKSEESFKNFKVILHKISDLTKEAFLSLVYVLYDKRILTFQRGSLRSKITYEKL
jgi:hypothetical protein